MIPRITRILSVAALSVSAASLHAEQLDVEKDTLKFGFIKLTDCAPIVIAKENGYFEEEGLQVEVIAQPNWNQLLDNVINGGRDYFFGLQLRFDDEDLKPLIPLGAVAL